MSPEWRTLDWLPDYEISEDGEIRRRTKSNGRGRRAGFRLRGGINQYGYRSHMLTMPDGKARRFLTHRLVCEAFHGRCPAAHLQVAHGDGDKTNNHFSNLRWATPRDNNYDKIAHGTFGRGRRNRDGVVVLALADVRAIRAKYSETGEIPAIARSFGLPHGTVWNICKRNRWFHDDVAEVAEATGSLG
jgi:hypothetical protein